MFHFVEWVLKLWLEKLERDISIFQNSKGKQKMKVRKSCLLVKKKEKIKSLKNAFTFGKVLGFYFDNMSI